MVSQRIMKDIDLCAWYPAKFDHKIHTLKQPHTTRTMDIIYTSVNGSSDTFLILRVFAVNLTTRATVPITTKSLLISF